MMSSLSSDFLFYLATGSLAIAFTSFFLGLAWLAVRVPNIERRNMDDLPPALEKAWWFVRFFQHYGGPLIPPAALAKRQKLLNSSGLDFFLTPIETYGLQFLSLIFFSSLSIWFVLLLNLGFAFAIFVFTTLCLIGIFYPILWLTEQKKKRHRLIRRSMPPFLDILTLCCECGLSINSGLTNYCEKGPRGPLRGEIERVLRDMKGGSTRIDALNRLSARMSNQELSTFVSLVVQSERLGMSLGDALRKFSEQKRTERFQEAEKLAMEAPMKMMGPLVIFIFPITFIMIAFPIAISAIEAFK